MFLRRLQRDLNKSEEIFDSQKIFKRITVTEPQGESHDNPWYLRILPIFDVPAPFIENEVIAELWGIVLQIHIKFMMRIVWYCTLKPI